MTAVASRERRKLERARRALWMVTGVLAAVAALWLVALSKPSNVRGVLVLEAFTAVPLGVVVWQLRRVRRRLRAVASLEPVEDPPTQQEPVRLPLPPDLRFDPSRRPDLVLRTRPLAVLIGTLLGVSLVSVLAWLMYRAAFFDVRIVLFAALGAAYLVVALRARIVVYDGVVWRRAFKRYRAVVSLSQLESVEQHRARARKKEGALPLSILRLSDSYGRTMSLKPALWTAKAATLRVVVATCAQTQGINLDEETADRLSRGVPPGSVSVPPWAYVRAAPPPAAFGTPPGQPPVTQRGLWTRRRPDGSPAKFQPLRLVVVLVALGFVPVAIVVNRVGTDALRSQRCSTARRIAADAAAFSSDPGALDGSAQRIAELAVRGLPARTYALGPGDIANSHNTGAVQRGAGALVDGRDVRWANATHLVAEVQIERFQSHAAALAFHRDYVEDHCRGGDSAFAIGQVPGSVGFRCNCQGSRTFDRLAFVRGDTRVQVIAWDLSPGADHGAVTALADGAAKAMAD